MSVEDEVEHLSNDIIQDLDLDENPETTNQQLHINLTNNNYLDQRFLNRKRKILLEYTVATQTDYELELEETTYQNI